MVYIFFKSTLVFTLKKFPFLFLYSFWSTDLWKNKDESWNVPQGYDPELIKEDKRKELESEIRLQVRLLLCCSPSKSFTAVLCYNFLLITYPEFKLFLTSQRKHKSCEVT